MTTQDEIDEGLLRSAIRIPPHTEGVRAPLTFRSETEVPPGGRERSDLGGPLTFRSETEAHWNFERSDKIL